MVYWSSLLPFKYDMDDYNTLSPLNNFTSNILAEINGENDF